VLLLPDAGGRLQPPLVAGSDGGATPPLSDLDTGIAQWSFDHATPAGIGTDTLPASRFLYLPLVAPMRSRGVLAIYPEQPRWVWIPEQRQHLDTMAMLAAIALERVHYVEVAQDAIIRMESERLRNSLLSALSHDLRTPLTSLVGLSETLATSGAKLSQAEAKKMARALYEQALRMSNLVTNLLDMARLTSGEVRLNRQWQPIEEVVGSALHSGATLLSQHQVQTRLPADLPIVNIDAVLIERVFCNLIENATKYTPPGSLITIAATSNGRDLTVCVSDNGPGIPAGREEAIFDKFTRGQQESAIPGVGLGLAICRAIVEAHGGSIHACRSEEGGAAFIFTIPLGTPPAMPAPEASIADPIASHLG
jgi:two-component system sensor histidine kinase KdpD